MKKMKKIFALLITMVMVLGMSTMAFAAEPAAPADGSITITPPSGLQDDDETTYTIYKVFDATVNPDDPSKVSYKLCDGDTLSSAMEAAGFSVDDAGNISFNGSMADTGDTADAAIAAIAAFVTDDDIVGTVTATGTAAVAKTGLEYGYYYITTTTGSLVTIDTTNIEAVVIDKNTIPEIDKLIDETDPDYGSYDDDGKKALAQIGTDVGYEVTLTVGKGAIGYVFHDVMDSRLAYNNDVSVTPSEAVDNTTTASGDTITVTFKDDWTKANEGATITITYSAKITAEALSDNPAKNTATLDFGEKYTTTETSTEVYTAKFTVTKLDDEEQPLAGAGFVVANEAGEYYKLDNGVVTWVTSIDDADEHVSDDSGAVAPFTGLGNGTYTLIEKTVPAGFNKAADSTFTIAEHDYTAENLEQETAVINMSGTELPSTGGIGTTIFYVVGAILMIGAGVVLVTRRRMNAQ